MKRILVINPNTSEAMTADVRATVDRIKRPDVEAETVHPPYGPESLESAYDTVIAANAMIDMLTGKETAYDGVLIACFGDPGHDALKEMLDGAVVGIAEAAIATALLLGNKYSILAAGERAVPLMENMVAGYGLKSRLASVECLGMSVTAVEEQKEEAIEKLTQAAERAAQKGADVLILGCAGMTTLKAAVEARTGMVILDPVETGYAMLEAAVCRNLKVSHSGLYARLPEKNYISR